jgi:hypothetical protein
LYVAATNRKKVAESGEKPNAATTTNPPPSERQTSAAMGVSPPKWAFPRLTRAAAVVRIFHRTDRENLNHSGSFSAAVPTFRDAVHWTKASDTKV